MSKDQANLVGRRLVDLVHRERSTPAKLVAALQEGWSPDCLRLLLASDDNEIVESAAQSLGLTGSMADVPALAKRLQHEETAVSRAVEQAMWSIFFRAGGDLAQAVLSRIAASIGTGDTETVIPLLTELIRIHPAYAEAYHQRAQAHYLADRYDAGLRDAKRVVRLNPHHFEAVALQGHCLGALGRWTDAVQHYQAALKINPRMTAVRRAMRGVRSRSAATTR